MFWDVYEGDFRTRPRLKPLITLYLKRKERHQKLDMEPNLTDSLRNSSLLQKKYRSTSGRILLFGQLHSSSSSSPSSSSYSSSSSPPSPSRLAMQDLYASQYPPQRANQWSRPSDYPQINTTGPTYPQQPSASHSSSSNGSPTEDSPPQSQASLKVHEQQQPPPKSEAKPQATFLTKLYA